MDFKKQENDSKKIIKISGCLLFIFLLLFIIVPFIKSSNYSEVKNYLLLKFYTLENGYRLSLNEEKKIKECNLSVKLTYLHHVSTMEAYCGSYCYQIVISAKNGAGQEKQFNESVFMDSMNIDSRTIKIFNYDFQVLDIPNDNSIKIKLLEK